MKRALLILSISLTGCKSCSSTPTCAVADQYAIAAATVLGPATGCKGTAAMANAFAAQLSKLNLCSGKLEGPVANAVCAPLVAFVVSIPAKIAPSDWECSNGVIADVAGAALTAACLTAPY